MMIKYLRPVLCIVLLFALIPSYAFGANDAADLSYRVDITVTDSAGSPKTSFDVGEDIVVKLSVPYTGAGKAPVYGLQGKLKFDSYVVNNTNIKKENDISMQFSDGVINYLFLDMSALGKSDSMLQNIGTAVFQAKNSGTFSLEIDSFTITNKDATPRYIEPFNSVQIIVGSGVKEISKSSLYEDIEAANLLLSSVTIADNPKNIYRPDFWYSTRSAQVFRSAIAEAETVFNNETAVESEILEAIEKLSIALSNFEGSKIIGPSRWSGSSDSSGVNLNYIVTASVKGGNGRIADGFEKQTVRATTSATIRLIPDSGFETEYIYINGEKLVGRDIYTIPEVNRDTTVVVTFAKKPPFADVKHDDWFYSAARFVYNKGLFTGTSDTKFSPNGKMSRAMLATVLYRVENEPSVPFADVFTDVHDGLWYSIPIIWANQNKIVNGYSQDRFAPNDAITREQIAVMLYRFAQLKGLNVESDRASLGFKDASKISDFAKESVAWAVSKGIMKGNADMTLNPSNQATRAEVATMLQRFIEME